MNLFKPPLPINIQENVADNWRKWKQRLQLHMEASGSMRKPEKQQFSLFLHLIGEEAPDDLQHILVTNCGAKARRLIPEICGQL